MAMEMKLQSAIALVIGPAKEKTKYVGQGDNRREDGRVTDGEGRPLSAVSAVVVADPAGILGAASVLLPDMQIIGVAPGSAIRLEGELTLVLKGRDYGMIASEVTAERQTPLGSWVEWATAAGSKKSAEVRAAS